MAPSFRFAAARTAGCVVSAATDTCAACLAPVIDAGGGGIWLRPDGTRTIYILCAHCAVERMHRPQAVMKRVEFNLGHAAEGSA